MMKLTKVSFIISERVSQTLMDTIEDTLFEAFDAELAVEFEEINVTTSKEASHV